MLIEISVRDLHNDIIKPSENGGFSSVVDSVTLKVLIRDTVLRLFILSQVLKITPKLLQICGYETFIIPKDMHIDLNITRARLAID